MLLFLIQEKAKWSLAYMDLLILTDYGFWLLKRLKFAFPLPRTPVDPLPLLANYDHFIDQSCKSK
jgi:hypothetical protein